MVWRDLGVDDGDMPPNDPRQRLGATIGIIVAIILAVVGLVLVGFVIFFVVALNNMGSNK
jgi:hypothetical protein